MEKQEAKSSVHQRLATTIGHWKWCCLYRPRPGKGLVHRTKPLVVCAHQVTIEKWCLRRLKWRYPQPYYLCEYLEARAINNPIKAPRTDNIKWGLLPSKACDDNKARLTSWWSRARKDWYRRNLLLIRWTPWDFDETAGEHLYSNPQVSFSQKWIIVPRCRNRTVRAASHSGQTYLGRLVRNQVILHLRL